MHPPREWYQMEQVIAEHFPQLRASQQKGLALWVYGTILAGSACQNAVIAALLILGTVHAVRQSVREWLYDGADKAAPCQTQVDVVACFVPLVRWILSWWQGSAIAFAVDATLHGDQVVALVISVLYRGSAIPVAWHIMPANQEGAWMPEILRLLRQLRPALPSEMTVLVLADRGLWSGRLWKRIRDLHWHPLLRTQDTITFQPVGQRRQVARSLVPGPGHAWVGCGTAFTVRRLRRVGTLCVVWDEGQTNPWVVLTDLPPTKVGLGWYGLRIWVELGFRALKGMGWQWQKTRRTDPDRVARHWLVLAVATLWVMATGTRVEDADQQGVAPAHLHTPFRPTATRPTSPPPRLLSVFCRGLISLQRQLLRGRLWKRIWLLPEPWPAAPLGLTTVCHEAT